jgi:ribosomal protein S18 acetylase RimI-like enzyme
MLDSQEVWFSKVTVSDAVGYSEPKRMMMRSLVNFEIRLASVDDAVMLSELGARLFEQAFGAVNTPDDMRDYLAASFSPEVQRAELSDPARSTFIAMDETDAPIGYAMLRRDTLAAGVVAQSPGELQRIYVDARWHGRGVGDALMSKCIDQLTAWSCDVFWLGVWQDNPRAIAFYRRAGFSTVGVQTFMLGRDLQHDFVMARSLR